MSRIRSIHPGLATDENYMALSHVAARVLPHIWCECDDQGVFEWKPLTLKAKILPAHNDSMEDVLAELERQNFIVRFSSDGKYYGAVRNFRRYQRPKKPKLVHPITDELRTYVALSAPSTEPDEDESNDAPQDERNPPPITKPRSPKVGKPSAEGGGRMEEEGESKKKPPRGGGAGYAFEGKIVKLTAENLDKWRKAYSAIPDIEAELTSLDAFYDGQLIGAERGNWFIRCGTALGKKHQEWVAKAAASSRPPAPPDIGRPWA